MSKFEVVISEQAKIQVRRISQYLLNCLCSKQAANSFLNDFAFYSSAYRLLRSIERRIKMFDIIKRECK